MDATTLEANAAPKSIVRRDTGEGYEELLTRPRERRSPPADQDDLRPDCVFMHQFL